MDIAAIATALAGAKNLVDIIQKVREVATSAKEDGVPAELRRELLGSEELAREQSAQIQQMLGAKTYPFLLRVGESFVLPPDLRKMEAAVTGHEIWDWTYCFNFRNMRAQTREHLRFLYLDKERPEYLRPDVATTTLAISEQPMPQEFGQTLYISGIALSSVEYDHIYNIPENCLLSTVVVKSENQKIFGFNNGIAMQYYMRRMLDFLFSRADDFNHYGEICIDHPPRTEAGRKLPPRLAAALA